MNCLELSKDFYYKVLEPRIVARCPHCLEKIAVGLFGNGSQCLGFDDEISRDHDWGLRVCILLNDEDYLRLGSDLNKVIKESPSEYKGYETSWEFIEPRGGVLSISTWFKLLLVGNEIPESPVDWLPIPEYELIKATNGEIWHDPLGEVTKIRKYLSYYPEDIWKKRLASKVAEISQSSGNFKRTFQRKDTVTASLALHYFVKEVMQIWFLLNRKYAPFYKWLYRRFLQLQRLPDGLTESISLLTGESPLSAKAMSIDKIIDDVREALNELFPASVKCEWFFEIAYCINDSIKDSKIRDSGGIETGGVWDHVPS